MSKGKNRRRGDEQVLTKGVSIRWIVSQPTFELGVADV
jgi:hypothetical protein